MKRNMKRRGFTLVELLIVIVVIGILSAMMMLSSTEAVTSAKASNIVSNLRNLKTATLACYIDSMDHFDKVLYYLKGGAAPNNATEGTTKEVKIGDVVKYLSGGTDIPEKDNYEIEQNTDGDWYLSYTLQGTNTEKTQIKQKLEGRAKSVGLLKDNTKATDNAYKAADDSAGKVYYYVR